jgi:beta-glucosidase
MPWIDETAAVLEAWYPGQKGGEAIAEILSGAVNPSGRLPLTFPSSESQLPHRNIQGDARGAPLGPVGRGGRYGRTFVADYGEGADVGYKWFLRRGERALFPFGYGLSYTTFGLSGLTASAEGTRVTASAKVRNSGARAGAAIAQFYVSGPAGANFPLRLAGWARIDLAPDQEREVTASFDPRLLASFDEGARVWFIRPGDYQVTAGFDAEQRDEAATIHLDAATLPP